MHLARRDAVVLGLTLALGLRGAAAQEPLDPAIADDVGALQTVVAKDQAAAPDDLKLQKAVKRAEILRQDILRNNYQAALRMTSEVALEDRSDAVQKALEPLTAALTRLATQQEAQVSTDLTKVLDDATDAIKNRKDPADFDSVLTELADAENANRAQVSSLPNHINDFQQLEAALRFVKGWQTYLLYEKNGDVQQAANALRDLAATESTFMPIPRSELLERSMAAAATGAMTLETNIKLDSLDDLAGAIADVEVLQRSGGYSMEWANLANAMENLRSAYLLYQEQNYAAALQQLSNNPFGAGVVMNQVIPNGLPADTQDGLQRKIAQLKNQLALEIVQALLATPDLPAPNKDELVANYLLRLAGNREQAADWPGLQQVLLLYQQSSATFNPPLWLQEDLAGLHAYLVGEKQEGAGQELDAIQSYRQALATLGKFFPADPAAAKLNALAKTHHDLYLQALQQPIDARNR